MTENPALEGCFEGLEGLLGHLSVGGASGEASWARLGGVPDASRGRFRASIRSSGGGFEVCLGSPWRDFARPERDMPY